MEKPSHEVQVLPKNRRVIILAGDKRIEDIVVFLMYKKLKDLIHQRD